jgi:hypothetical protein
MSIQTNQTAARIFSAVLHAEGFRCARADLERHFSDTSPSELNDAIIVLLLDGALVSDAEALQVPFESQTTPVVERLAAAINAILATSDLTRLTLEQVCTEAERDPAMLEDRREVLLALTLLDYCQLATRDDDGRWRPTRAHCGRSGSRSDAWRRTVRWPVAGCRGQAVA